MSTKEAPQIDGRTAKTIFEDTAGALRQRLGVKTDADPMAEALLRIFARYCELVIQRLNRVPDKNYLAFLHALNISQIPPHPAEVPLTFQSVKTPPEKRSIVVPRGCRVAAAPGEGETEPIVFETTRDLALTNAVLEKVVSLDPAADRYTDKSHLADPIVPEGQAGEFAFAAQKPVPHEFYIQHEAIFGTTGISELTLSFRIGSEVVPRTDLRTIDWYIPTADGDLALQPLKDTTLELTQSGQVIFAELPEWPTHAVFGRLGHWLACRLRYRLPRTGPGTRGGPSSSIPEILAVKMSARWQVDEGTVSMGFSNSLALDLSRDFFPFGEHPRFNDVFYVNSESFARPQADIALRISLTNPASGGKRSPLPPVSKAGEPIIQWEHWSGKRWIELNCKDTTEALTEDGQVSFTRPSSVRATTVNGEEGFWIRARLVAGSYGEDERLEFTESGFPSTLGPSIQSITVSSSLAGPVRPDGIMTHNNLVFNSVEGLAPFSPFQPAAEPYKALYLGFRVPDEADTRERSPHAQRPDRGKPRNPLADGPFDLYVHLREPANRRTFLRDTAEQDSVKLTWQYWNGQVWKDVTVNDETESLNLPGVVRLHAGQDIASWEESSLGRDLYWLRALWTAGEYDCPPELRRLLLNTVAATETVTLENELLGSSNGKPNQVFRSKRAPILEDLQLEVREPDIPEAEDLARLRDEEGPDAVSMDPHADGKAEQIWLRWHEVEDYLSSTPRDRHFLVRRETGEIIFGDGLKGIIPPAGSNNVRLRRYQTGGGASGNKAAGTVSQLRASVPYVDSVTNLENACGGQDAEDPASLRERGSRRVRHRGRAVTAEDYEDLAKLASPLVGIAKCYPCQDRATDPSGKSLCPGVVSVVIVPRSQASKPLPDLTLLRRVRSFLDQHRVPDTALTVLAPEYVQICIEAVVVPESAHVAASIISRCVDKLSEYLHPVNGGDGGRGWAFGQRPHDSDIYSNLESVQGLEYVRTLDVRAEEDRPGLLKSGDYLICSGDHSIRLGA